MSLTPDEEVETRNELAANFRLANVSLNRIAKDLDTTPEHVQQVLDLDPDRIEEPWVLSRYLDDVIEQNGDKPLAYSKLKGSPAEYWFLDQGFIKQNKLVKENY
ncbi:DUF2316 family protein [Lentilactobacillus kosonis]|uniref:DUF2316 family protein n=1 Tax=Lentilactobacillus kosonis TaxID=2810561 RepID=A0A401FIL4_9LACO|nr:DUF2316 family protein [Lentilactobacillus kosonis]GAY72202.1 hypothetical protein NBRC111893_348 [Lentilactobacillus kosonis]